MMDNEFDFEDEDLGFEEDFEFEEGFEFDDVQTIEVRTVVCIEKQYDRSALYENVGRRRRDLPR